MVTNLYSVIWHLWRSS